MSDVRCSCDDVRRPMTDVRDPCPMSVSDDRDPRILGSKIRESPNEDESVSDVRVLSTGS